MDDAEDLDTSLQSMINLSSSEADDKDDVIYPLKKTKGAIKTKISLPKTSKKVQKRIRKCADRITKSTSKRYAKTGGSYQNKSFTVTVDVSEETDQKLLLDYRETAHLLPVVDILEKYNFKYEVNPDTNKQHDDFYLQDKYMNTFFKYYPEFLCVDFLCEIIELELNLYLFISADSNGHCEIISAGLFKSCESGLLWFCDVFKKHNFNWRKIRLIMSDKRARNIEILKSSFPEKLTLISFFHSMKTLKKDLYNLDCKITEEEVNKILQIFEQMIFSVDESSYSELLKQLKSMPLAISTYFRKTWHQRKDSWALNEHINSKIILKSFNSYLSLIRKTIRPMICSLDSTETVIKNLCSCLEKMRCEKFKKFTSLFPILPFTQKHSVTHKYSKLLTTHAVELISEQISHSFDVKNIKKLASGKFVCASEDIVTINTCSCNFFQLLFLPCCHIFCVRRALSLPFYVESLCSFRWMASTYHNNFLDLQSVFFVDLKSCNPESRLNSDFLNPEIYQKYFKVSAALWSLLITCPKNVAHDRLLVLKSIIRAWEHGIKVNIKAVDDQKDNFNKIVVEEPNNDLWKNIYGVSLKEILDSDNDISVLPLTM